MKGTVSFINPRNGFFAVQVEDNDFTVIELTDTCEVEAGDVVSGDLDSHGGTSLKNVTKNEVMSVYIQGIHCAVATARAMVYR